jgi:hypothetical protein
MNQDQKTPQGNIVQICMTLGFIISIPIFQMVAPKIFPSSPTSGINISRSIWAGVVGGGATLVGAGVGILIERSRN